MSDREQGEELVLVLALALMLDMGGNSQRAANSQTDRVLNICVQPSWLLC